VGEPMRIVVCDAPARLDVEWATEAGWRVELDLGRDGGETVLTSTQVFAPGTDVVDHALGWHWYLDELDAEVGGRPEPGPWEVFLAETGSTYGRAPQT